MIPLGNDRAGEGLFRHRAGEPGRRLHRRAHDVSVAPPTFAETPEIVFSGSLSGYYRSNGNVVGVDVNLNAANDAGSVNYTGGWVRADDYRSGDGTTIKSTMYETQNHVLSLSRKLDDGVVTLQLGGQFIPYQGYVNQYMDMVDNKSFFVNGAYEKNFEWGQLEANAFYNHVRHTTGFIAPDKDGDMPMDTRSSDMGYRVAGTLEPTGVDIVRLDNELYYNQRLDLWENPTYGRGVFRGNLNFVRGQRVDGVNIYHIMPVNATLALDHILGNWTTTAEVQFVGAKTEVSEVHNELETSAYALFNLRTSYQLGQLKIDLGIENLFDTEYDLPLGGANLVNYQVSSMMGTSPARSSALLPARLCLKRGGPTVAFVR